LLSESILRKIIPDHVLINENKRAFREPGMQPDSARVLSATITWQRFLLIRLSSQKAGGDDGPERQLALKRIIRLLFIQPGKPQQNPYGERLNRTVRHEWLDEHLFESIEQAEQTTTEWLWRYNADRPNMALGGAEIESQEECHDNFI
jgi:putative transposase